VESGGSTSRYGELRLLPFGGVSTGQPSPEACLICGPGVASSNSALGITRSSLPRRDDNARWIGS
jgi:hypothetical protein